MTATYTFDVFTTLDGYGSYAEPGDWGGYWGKQGPELLARRAAMFDTPQRMVFGATTYREFADMIAAGRIDPGTADEWFTRMRTMPLTVVSNTIDEAPAWPDAAVANGDAVEVVRRMKDESDTALRSHGSLSMNHALMAAGLVDLVQVTIFPVVSGRTGTDPVFGGADDFDLQLVDSRVLDGDVVEVSYRPTRRVWGV